MIGQVAKWSGIMLLVLIMVLALFVLFAPRLSGWQIDTVLSGSMSPVLKVGDAVVTKPVDPNAITVGDIITYRSPVDGKLVTHRVVEVEKHSAPIFRTKGDANSSADSYLVPAQNIVGKVSFHIPLLGYVAQFIKTPLGFILLLALPGAVIIGMELKNIWAALSEKPKQGAGVER